MAYRPYYTPVPNEILDQHLKYLNQAELKVLLVVVRQVLGWIDPKTNKRKRKDWISISFFKRKTGLSHKSISLAINQLIHHQVIVAMDYHENILKSPQERRGKKRIYYSYAPYFYSLKKTTCVDMLVHVFTFRDKTKETPTKENYYVQKSALSSSKHQTRPTRRLSDKERYQQIMRSGSPPYS